jgi:hypothetical protein
MAERSYNVLFLCTDAAPLAVVGLVASVKKAKEAA